MKCLYHLSLPTLIFISNSSNLTVPLMYSFLILSFLVTRIENLNIFISATSISSTCFFVNPTVSSSYTIGGLTTVLYTFPFTQLVTPVSDYFQYFSPSVPSCLHSPLYFFLTTTIFLHRWSQILKLLYTFGIFVSSIFTVSLSFSPFMHKCLVFDLFTFIRLFSEAYLQHSSLHSTSSLVSSQNTI